MSSSRITQSSIANLPSAIGPHSESKPWACSVSEIQWAFKADCPCATSQPSTLLNKDRVVPSSTNNLEEFAMPNRSKVYRVMIGSPSDLAEQRKTATEAINEWDAQHSDAEG